MWLKEEVEKIESGVELKNSNSNYKLDIWLDIHTLWKSIILVLNQVFLISYWNCIHSAYMLEVGEYMRAFDRFLGS